ncbi:ANTAR domain-containing protein [Amycolatopsis australiensis]|uniref:ANTAR domain-containing protein n=2 Tax=Amycolatopsis australiensis TaxID=546364 RepID=A0A1K1SRC2_9PSEU|nr:ANTAR domain-containing protein [Amycolatopsis australiensis]
MVELTTRLVADGADAAWLLRTATRSVSEVTGASAAGLLVADPRGGVEVLAASDDTSRFLELLQTLTGEGPCVDCIRTGEVVAVPDLDGGDSARWPAFRLAALSGGFAAVHAFPLRLRGRALGGVNVFHERRRELGREELAAAQALADLAVLGMTAESGDRREARLAETTLAVLNGRVRVAQAVGMVAAARNLDPGAARVLLQSHADRTRATTGEVAWAITAGTLDPAELVATVLPSHSAADLRAEDG